jgi:outer membrane protein assembly factor BamB/plastocyanin
VSARSGRRGRSLAIGVAVVAVAQLFAPTAVARAAPGPLASKPAGSNRRDQVLSDYGKLPIAFQPNVGQAAAGISYLARGNGFGLALSPGGLTMTFRPQASVPSPPSGRAHYVHSNPADAAVVRVAFPGADSGPTLVAGDKLPGTVNYLLGPNRKSWHQNVPTYGRVTYQALYPGIDLEFSGAGGKLEYIYTLAAGSDPGVIRLAFSGQDALSVDAAGNLVATVKGEILTQPPPVAYQTVGTERRSVSSRYVLLDAKTVGFQLGDYDHALPLTIDPVLVYSTYLGGTSDDIALGLAMDTSGNAYVTGYTFSTDFPTTTGSYQTTNKGSYDVFVSKLDPTGSTLLYSTYIGGTKDDEAGAIAVEAATGRVFVTGVTDSTAYPTTTGAYQKTFKGGTWDAFLSKLNIFGSSLTYSTYIGGTADDEAFGVTLDTAASKAMIAGLTSSTNYPTTASAYQKTNKGSYDAFVTKIDPNPNVALSFSTYLGGTGDDEALGIVRADTADREFVVGLTSSTAFPTTTGAFQTTNKGGYDAFFTKMNKLGSTLNYSTYLGGSSDDFGVAVTADAAANGYLTGETLSTDFPTTAGVFQTTGHGDDAFVTKVNPNSGVALPYSTYLGGSATDVGLAITVDSDTNAYVVGSTISTDFPTAGGPVEDTFRGATDAFASELDPVAATLAYSTYLGSGSYDVGTAVAGASAGAAFIAGFTDSVMFPIAETPFQSALKSGYDAFVAKLGPGTADVATITDTNISPPTLTAARGDVVQWNIPVNAGLSHSATDATGMGYFDSGVRTAGSVYEFAFPAAGSYPVVDTSHGLTELIQVPMDVTPPGGSQTSNFQVTWAAAPPRSGFAYDVQIQRPGLVFADWMTGVATTAAVFTPDAGDGTYAFRSRVRNLTNGLASSYSAVVPIVVADVSVTDTGFIPDSVTVARDGPLTWTFPTVNTQNHTATDSSGMGLFDSGDESPGATYTFDFTSAGTYPVIDNGSLNTGSVTVPMSVTPSSGDPASSFQIVWAAAAPPSGYVFDVQIQRPGSHVFSDWMTGVTLTTSSFVPDKGEGLYSFQARVRNSVNGNASGYSPISSLSAATWAQVGKTSAHTGYNPYEDEIGVTNVTSLEQSWTSGTFTGQGWSPVVVNGVVYVDRDLTVDALDAQSGAVIWSDYFGGITSPPVVVDGYVFVNVGGGTLWALHADTGIAAWSFPTGIPYNNPPAVANRTVFVTSSNGSLYALFESSGVQRWVFTPTDQVFNPPAAANGYVYVDGKNSNVFKVKASNGQLSWSGTLGGGAMSPPVVGGALLYVTSDDGKLDALSASTGLTTWSGTIPFTQFPPAVGGGFVLVGSPVQIVTAFNASGCGGPLCSPVWTGAPLPASIVTQPTIANGVAYVGAGDGHVYAYSLAGCGSATCSQIWTSSPLVGNVAAPAVVNGTIYAQGGDVVTAFRIGD